MKKLFAGTTQKLYQLMEAPGPFELIKVKNDSFLLRDSFISQSSESSLERNAKLLHVSTLYSRLYRS